MARISARPIKIIMRGNLVDRVDAALQRGLGGFRTRQALFEEAIDYYLHELNEVALAASQDTGVGAGQPIGRPQGESAPSGNREMIEAPSPNRQSERAESFAEFAIRSGGVGRAALEVVDSIAQVADGPILGLHNRDWPSLQAISVLAEVSTDGPVPVEAFYARATAAAWQMAERLALLERSGVGKPTALLPSNRAKPRAAEANYQNFALGWIGKTRKGNAVNASGPLFVWRASGLVWRGNELCIGLTDAGLSFLSCAEGLTPQGPHSQSSALEFMQLLDKHGPSDAGFFQYVLSEVAKCPTRLKLVERIKSRQRSSSSVAASLAQGYIARGREWGIIEPKQTGSKYSLTAFGKNLMETLFTDREDKLREAGG